MLAEQEPVKQQPPVSWRGPVVVRSPNWLGDAIMTFAAVRNLKQALGLLPLAVAAPEKFSYLWTLCPFVDEVIPLPQPRQLFPTAQLLRAKNFQEALLLPNSLRVAAEARLARIPRVYGYAGHARRLLLTRTVPRWPFDLMHRHHRYYYLNLVEALTGIGEETPPALRVDAAPGPRTRVSLCPGAEYGPAKRWLPDRFVEVAEALRKELGCEVVLLGAPKDAPVAEEIARKAPWILNQTGKTTLPELVQALADSRLVISNDSGAMHLAAALGVPTVGLFGSTDPNWTSPLGPRVRVVRRHVPCSPCFLRECPLDFACMRSIQTQDVVAAALEIIPAT